MRIRKVDRLLRSSDSPVSRIFEVFDGENKLDSPILFLYYILRYQSLYTYLKNTII